MFVENNLTCATNASLNDTVERDGVQLTCDVTYNGTNSASMVWEGVIDAPDAVKTGNTIRRSYSVAASVSGVSSFTCNTSFVVNNATIVGLATNMPLATCATPAIKVKCKYSFMMLRSSESICWFSTDVESNAFMTQLNGVLNLFSLLFANGVPS